MDDRTVLAGSSPNTEGQPTCGVLVIGGGVAGMQCAKDLSQAGFRVYLVEEKWALGGTAALLDKTYPTNSNDCFLCVVPPKLTDAGRYPNCWNVLHGSRQCTLDPRALEASGNIQVITGATVKEVIGPAGNMTARIHQQARFVDTMRCASCGDCVEVCPVSLPDPANQGKTQRKAIFKLFPQATPVAYAIERRGTAPCREACPIGQRAQGYIALIRERRFADAYRAIVEDNPFPSICGRVCNHHCEDECTRGQVDAPVSIMVLKRFVADWATAHPEAVLEGPDRPAVPGKTARIAVVGSGPAGLTAAHDLALMGYPVTVFEALPVPGGMMRVGIPSYRLARELVQKEIDQILRLGVGLKLNSKIEDLDDLFDQGYEAVFLAIGSHAGRKLRLPGSDLPGVMVGTQFLRDVALDRPVPIDGQRVVVLGGGNAAVDTARTALRLGARSVIMACLESCELMPAHSWEVAEAIEEGVHILNDRSFLEIVGSGQQVTGIRCCRVDFRGFRADGSPDMDEFPETEQVIPADVVVFATGQGPDSGWLGSCNLDVSRNGTIVVDNATLATNRRGVFAGGDGTTGVGFIVDAIAAGRQAARSIDQFLRGVPFTPQPAALPKVVIQPIELESRLRSGDIVIGARQEPAHESPTQRVTDFREITATLTEEQAVAEAQRCLACGDCSECLECVRACQVEAVRHDMRETELTIKVGSVVVATGAAPFVPWDDSRFGGGRFANVVTSLELERMLSPTGPSGGWVLRPSDGSAPRRIGWVLCVGPHNAADRRSYCSSFCCMSAAKEALLTIEQVIDAEAVILGPEVLSRGYESERYLAKVRRTGRVQLLRGEVTSLQEGEGTGNLLVTYHVDGIERKEELDMLVLSVGVAPGPAQREWAETLGVRRNEHGFHWTVEGHPTTASRSGFFAAGVCREPMDISRSIADGSGAAGDVARLLVPVRDRIEGGLQAAALEWEDAEPRIGVFVCECGHEIGAVVDVPSVVEFSAALPGVVYAEGTLYACSHEHRRKIAEAIQAQRLNCVVIASCTPRTHEPLFQRMLADAGLHPGLLEMTNIREQASWPHRDEPVRATEAAQRIVAIAVAKASLLTPQPRIMVDVHPSVLVIGGGMAGMTAALCVAAQGFEVHLVEKSTGLGGFARFIHRTLADGDVQPLVYDTVRRVNSHPGIKVHLGARPVALSGWAGAFRSELEVGRGRTTSIDHGAVIVATGAEAASTADLLYGRDRRVCTQAELGARLISGPALPSDVRSIVMVQCIGSRTTERAYCSQVCCGQALNNALALKASYPSTEIWVLHRGMRTSGFDDELYQRAQEAGIRLQRHSEEQPPSLAMYDGSLRLTWEDEHGDHTLRPDLVVLSTGIVAADNKELEHVLNLDLNGDGFFASLHSKLRPLESSREGIYLCGMARGPRNLREAIVEGQGAAIKAIALLSRRYVHAPLAVARVNERICSGCGLCIDVCPNEARVLDAERGIAVVLAAMCVSCGACAVACPNGASDVIGFTKVQELARIAMALD